MSVVIGSLDQAWGDRVTAVVVLNRGESVSGSDLIAFCRERLALYKSPKSVAFRNDLQRDAMGKFQKTDLRITGCSETKIPQEKPENKSGTRGMPAVYSVSFHGLWTTSRTT